MGCCACEGTGFRYTSDLSFYLSILYYHNGLTSLHMRCATGRRAINQKGNISFQGSRGRFHRCSECLINHRFILHCQTLSSASVCFDVSHNPMLTSILNTKLSTRLIDPRPVLAKSLPVPSHDTQYQHTWSSRVNV